MHLLYFRRIANGGNARGMNAVSGIKRLSGKPLHYLRPLPGACEEKEAILVKC